MENKLLRFLFGKWMLLSAVYAKMRRLFQHAGLDKFFVHQQEVIIQDILIPSQQAGNFYDFLQQNTPIYPMWICPMQSFTKESTYDLCPLKKIFYISILASGVPFQANLKRFFTIG